MKTLVRKGIIKRSLVSGLVRRSLLATGNKRWQYNFDGIDDYIQLPDIKLFVGDIVDVVAYKPVITAAAYVFSTVDVFDMHFGVSSNNDYLFGGGSVTVNENTISSPQSSVPDDNSELSISYTATKEGEISLCGRGYLAPRFWPGYIKNLRITRANPTEQYPDLSYPISDGWANNPVIREVLVGDGTWDGTAINFNEENWELV
nr:hypothetical protein [uncultured Vibrio sp.]